MPKIDNRLALGDADFLQKGIDARKSGGLVFGMSNTVVMPANRGRPGGAGPGLLVREARLAEVDMNIDAAWQDMEPVGVDTLACRRQLIRRPNLDYLAAIDCDRQRFDRLRADELPAGDKTRSTSFMTGSRHEVRDVFGDIEEIGVGRCLRLLVIERTRAPACRHRKVFDLAVLHDDVGRRPSTVSALRPGLGEDKLASRRR